MKRSKMLEIMQEAVNQYHLLYVGNPNGYTSTEHLLRAVEAAGMAPPPVAEPCQTHVVNQHNQILQTEDSVVYVNRWEVE